MVSLHHRLFTVPATCVLTGAIAVAGLEGCANRQAKNTTPVYSTYSPQPAVSNLPSGQYQRPVEPLTIDPFQPTREPRSTDRVPNFLPEKMPEDGPLEAPGSDGKNAASLQRRDSKLAGMRQRMGMPAPKSDKPVKRQAKTNHPAPAAAREEDPLLTEEPTETRVNRDDKLAQNKNKKSRQLTAREASLQPKKGAQAARPVKLGKPAEIYQYSDESVQARTNDWRLPTARQTTTYEAPARPTRQQQLPARTVSSSASQNIVERPAPQQSANDEFAPLPEWSDSPASRAQPLIRSRPQNFQMPSLQTELQSETPEPTRLAPVEAREVSFRREVRQESSGPLTIDRLAICREVRGFDDFTEIDVSRMQAGESFLIYAALENFRSVSTLKGFQTLTLSSLEVWTRAGQQVSQQPLGTASDVADARRSEYYLTHAVKVPENLADGDYVLQLHVYDVNSKQSTKSLVAIRITGGHGRPGAKGGTSESAGLRASNQR